MKPYSETYQQSHFTCPYQHFLKKYARYFVVKTSYLSLCTGKKKPPLLGVRSAGSDKGGVRPSLIEAAASCPPAGVVTYRHLLLGGNDASKTARSDSSAARDCQMTIFPLVPAVNTVFLIWGFSPCFMVFSVRKIPIGWTLHYHLIEEILQTGERCPKVQPPFNVKGTITEEFLQWQPSE